MCVCVRLCAVQLSPNARWRPIYSFNLTRLLDLRRYMYLCLLVFLNKKNTLSIIQHLLVFFYFILFFCILYTFEARTEKAQQQ